VSGCRRGASSASVHECADLAIGTVAGRQLGVAIAVAEPVLGCISGAGQLGRVDVAGNVEPLGLIGDEEPGTLGFVGIE
jgi:hypothetical protein